MGEAWLVAAVAVAIAAAEVIKTRSRWVVPFLVIVVLGDKPLTETIKALVDRARPTLNPIAHTPDEHSSTAAAF